MTIRTYSELVALPSFNDRFEYLKLDQIVGESTFGFERYLNQMFYNSPEWKAVRNYVIIRDNGCDLGAEGFDIFGKVLIHHMNPIFAKDITSRSEYLLNPEFLITTKHSTHNAIHFGSAQLLDVTPIDRKPNDTCPWR